MERLQHMAAGSGSIGANRERRIRPWGWIAWGRDERAMNKDLEEVICRMKCRGLFQKQFALWLGVPFNYSGSEAEMEWWGEERRQTYDAVARSPSIGSWQYRAPR